MRALIVREAPAAEALDGRAEAIPLADSEVDGVFVAQAIHWFANDDEIAEIARAGPGRMLAIVRDEVDDGLASPLPEAYRERLGSCSRIGQSHPRTGATPLREARSASSRSGASSTSRCPTGTPCSLLRCR